jgi:hypothetical protein
MGKRRHEYASAGSHDPAPLVGLDTVLEDTGKGKPSAGVKAAEKTHSRKDIKAAIRKNIQNARNRAIS